MRRFARIAFNLLGIGVIFISCEKEPELALTSSSSVELSVEGSSATITFTANRDWSTSSSDTWLKVSPSSGIASDKPISITVRCEANTTYDDRTATVTVRMEGLSQIVTIKQPANKGIVLPQQVFDLQSDSKTIDIEVQANVQYTVSSSVDWIKQTGTKGLTSKTLSFSIEENSTYDPREGQITIKPQDSGVQEQIIRIKQAQKDAIIVEKTSYDMPYGGGEVEIKVESNVSFNVTPSVDWIQYIQTKALSKSTVVLKINENMTYSSRQGKVEIKEQNGNQRHSITINQAGRIAVTSVELDQSSLSILPGETAKLTAIVKPDNASDKTVSWSSSDATIVTVDNAGTVTAIKEGSATITAKAGEKSAVCNVQVCVAVSSIQLNKKQLTINVGETETLIATIKPDKATDKTVTWTSSNEDVASVDENGEVTAISKGNAIISAKAGNKTAECNVTVCIPVSSIILDKGELTLYEGEEYTLTATVYPDDASNKTVTWRCSDYTIADVYSNGKVSALKGGVATITAKAGDKTAECIVTVRIPVASIKLDKTELTLKPNESYSLIATVYPDNASDKTVVWSSSDSQVVSVDNTGKVTALNEGTAIITAESGGEKATCTVIVLWAPEGAVNLGIVMTRDDGSKYTLYWAECNLGATTPEDNGDSYAWGEVEPTFRGAEYKYFSSYAFPPIRISKYNNYSEHGPVDNKKVLDPEDDAAHVVLGGSWRMPTRDELWALMSECTWTWTSRNGKQGYEVKSKVSTNLIFLPAAPGIRNNTTGMGIYGTYWSATLFSDPTCAYAFLFNSGGVNMVEDYRGYGNSIRPVCE